MSQGGKGNEDLPDILKWAWFVVSSLLLIFLIPNVGCSQWGMGKGDGTWQRIQAQGVLRVGMDASYPPFESIDEEGEFVGYDVDLARELARRWDVEVQFFDIHFDGLYDALCAKKVDLLVSALPHDRTLTEDILYSEPYFNAGQVLVVPQGEISIRAVEDLEGKRVAVELGAEAHQLLLQMVRDRGVSADIITGRQPEEMFSLLKKGDVDALICDRVTAYGNVKGEALHIVEPTLTSAPFVMAAHADSPVLISKVDEALKVWRENGFLVDLEKRWLR
ncbi:MAG: substrate-binding periplasmic protein [Anaerolineales bacterium]